MLSRITIEINFDNGQPYIKCVNNTSSDDVKDKLITFFRQRLGNTSNWCRVEFPDYLGRDDNSIFYIHPITPNELIEQSAIMGDQAELNQKFEEKQALSH